jgi:acetyltransferase
MLRRVMTLPRAPKPGRFRPESLFRPKSVVVVGASGPLGAAVLRNLRAGTFEGDIAAADTPAEIAALPAVPDLALICHGDGPAVAEAMTALGARGTAAGAVLGIAGGLREIGRRAGMRVLGPGSFGIAVPSIGLNATAAHLAAKPGRVALVSQSAALCRAVLDWAEPNGVGFSHVVGIGGNDDIGFGLVLDWLSRDPGTGAILLDLRRIKDARVFLSAARAAARLRPVVALRAGGRLLDAAGAAEATLEAALRRVGVLSVTRLEDLLAAAETLTRAKPARNESLAVVTNAVGPAWLAADALLREGLSLTALAPATREVLTLADFTELTSRVHEPDERTRAGIVYTGVDAPIRLAEAASLLAGAKEVGGVLVVHAPTGEADGAAFAALGAAAKALRVPLLVAAMGETTAAAHRHALAAAGLPVFATPEQAVRGFLHLVQDRRNRAAARELPPAEVLRIAPDRAAVAQAFGRAREDGRLTLTQDEALAVLAAYGIASVPTRRAGNGAEATVVAAALGWPVVIKRRRAERPDEGGRGALVLDLRDAVQVQDAVRLLEHRTAPGAAPGFIVQKQVPRTRELLIRLGEDPLFGPTIAFGRGGTSASAYADVAVDLPPLNLPLAHAVIQRTRVGRTLGTLHDRPAADEDAIADALVRVSQLLVDFPEIGELDLNPLFADAAGVLAADAWIRLRPDDAPRARLAIAPYPADLARRFNGRSEAFLIRPIRPEDAEAHTAFFGRLTPEDVRYRFFTALRELSAEQIVRLTQVDYEREIAFIAVREATGETVGVSRLVCEAGTPNAEFAVVVQPDAKGQGLASELMRRLFDWARTHGVAEIVGQVLADNGPMLAFVRRLGFTVRRLPDEPELTEARYVPADH